MSLLSRRIVHCVRRATTRKAHFDFPLSRPFCTQSKQNQGIPSNRKFEYGNKFRLDFHTAKLDSEQTLSRFPKTSSKHYEFAASLISTYNNPMHGTFSALTNETRPLYLDLINKHLEIAIDIESQSQSQWIKSLTNRNLNRSQSSSDSSNIDENRDYSKVPPYYISTYCDFLIHSDFDKDARLKNFQKANKTFINYFSSIEEKNDKNDNSNNGIIDASYIEIYFNYAQFLDDGIKHYEKANEYYSRIIQSLEKHSENDPKNLLSMFKMLIELRYGFFLYKTQNFNAAIPYLQSVIDNSGLDTIVRKCKDDKHTNTDAGRNKTEKNNEKNETRQSLSDISAQMAQEYDYDDDDNDNNDENENDETESTENVSSGEATESSLQQKEELTETHFHGLFASVYLGSLYLDLEKIDVASEYYTNVIKILNNYEISNTNVSTMLLNECVLYFDKINDYNNATDYYVQVLKMERILRAKLGTNNKQAESHNINLDNLIIGAHLMSNHCDPHVKVNTQNEGVINYKNHIKMKKETGIEKATRMFDKILQIIEGKSKPKNKSKSKSESESKETDDSSNDNAINFTLDKICYQNPYYYYGLHCLNKLKDYNKAKELFFKALEVNPEFPTILFYLSMTCVQIKDYENGKLYLEKAKIMNEDVVDAKIKLHEKIMNKILE